MEPLTDVKPKYTQLFINNEWVNSTSGKTFDDINPVDTKVITKVQVKFFDPIPLR